jgi:hypothetical protein
MSGQSAESRRYRPCPRPSPPLPRPTAHLLEHADERRDCGLLVLKVVVGARVAAARLHEQDRVPAHRARLGAAAHGRAPGCCRCCAPLGARGWRLRWPRRARGGAQGGGGPRRRPGGARCRAGSGAPRAVRRRARRAQRVAAAGPAVSPASGAHAWARCRRPIAGAAAPESPGGGGAGGRGVGAPRDSGAIRGRRGVGARGC